MCRLRCRVMERFGIAETMGYGPRYLYSTGQLHKSGADSELFLMLAVSHDNDIPVPGKSYTLGTLVDAQPLGDLQALETGERRGTRIHLDSDVPAAINELVDEID